MKMMRFALLALLVLAGLTTASMNTSGEDNAQQAQTYKFLFYFNGSRVGWTKASAKTIKLDGREITREIEDGYVEIQRSHDNSVFKTHYFAENHYELDGRAITTKSVTNSGMQTVTSEVKYGEKTITIKETVDDGEAQTTTLQRGDKNIMCDNRAWQVLKQDGPPQTGEILEFWGVDADEHQLVKAVWTVDGNVERKLDDGSAIKGVEIQTLEGGRANTLVFGDDDWPLLVETGGGFSMERTSKIPQPFKAERVSLRNVMDVNVTVQKFKQLDELDIHFEFEHDDGDGVPAIVDTNAYHDVVKYDDGYALRLKSQKLDDDFERAYPLTEIPENVRAFLKPTAMCQSDDKELAAQAKKLAKGKDDAASVARAIMRWTNRRLKGGSGDTGSASAKQAYDEKRGDCTEHSALFTALARAAGLPARNVGGMVYAVLGEQAVFGYHQWAEVWLGEWVPVDPTVNELGTSARYIQFEYDEPGQLHGRGRSGRTMKQGIDLIVDAYTLKGEERWVRDDAPVFDFDAARSDE